MIIKSVNFNFKSPKFKFLNRLYNNSNLASLIPPFLPANQTSIDHFNGQKKFILRSALENEGSISSLQSGKSISIKDICSIEQFNKAFETIKSQKNFCEAIFQEQIDYQLHGTCLIYPDFFYCELQDTISRKNHLFANQNTWSGPPWLIDNFKIFLNNLRPILHEYPYIIELGKTQKEIYLFQLQPISEKMVELIFPNNFVLKLIENQKSWNPQNKFLSMIKTEWHAYRFRQNQLEMNINSRIANWYFIFHYYYIYCLIFKKRGSVDSYLAFLSELHQIQPRYYWSNALTHIKIAFQNQQTNFTLKDHSFEFFFIGKGKNTYETNSQIAILVNPGPTEIYQLKDIKVILTNLADIFSHVILASVELKLFVVANIPIEKLILYRQSSKIFIDFDSKKISVE